MSVPDRLHVATPKARYKQQGWHCRARGIPFLLTYEEWWALWKPKWKKRGCKKGQYVMARFGDAGAYEIGNVEIILCEDNHRQMSGRPKPPRSALHRQRISLAKKGKRLTTEHKRKIGDAQRGIAKPPFSDTHRRNISIAMTGRKCKPFSSAHRKALSIAMKKYREAQRVSPG